MDNFILFALLLCATVLYFYLSWSLSLQWKEGIILQVNNDMRAQQKVYTGITIDVTEYNVTCDGTNDNSFSMQQIFYTIIPSIRRNDNEVRIIVVVPQDCVVLSGPLTIESIHDVTLQIDGKLQAWDIARNNYTTLGIWPMMEPLITYGNSRDIHGLYYQYQPFIYINNVSNVRITGNGIIDGFGQPWWDIITSKNQSSLNLLSAGRPNLLQILNSSFIEIDTITLTDSPFWTLHPVLSQYIHIHHITITAPLYSPNVDGIDPEYVYALCVVFISKILIRFLTFLVIVAHRIVEAHASMYS